jgi:hypothetical protein
MGHLFEELGGSDLGHPEAHARRRPELLQVGQRHAVRGAFQHLVVLAQGPVFLHKK